MTAKLLMRIDSKIWERHGWGSGSDVVGEWETYLKELSAMLPFVVADEPVGDYVKEELIANNFHTLVQALEELGK